MVEWNHKLYLGLAHFHASFVHADAYEYGPQVARLQYAEGCLGEVAALSASAPHLCGIYKEGPLHINRIRDYVRFWSGLPRLPLGHQLFPGSVRLITGE